MNDWINLLCDSAPIQAIYGEIPPSLRGVDLHEIVLHRDGPRVLLRFDLRQFPTDPPKKWKSAGFNCVQLKLIAVDVHSLSIIGLKPQCTLDLNITKNEGRVHIFADNGEMAIAFSSEYLVVDTISAYVKG